MVFGECFILITILLSLNRFPFGLRILLDADKIWSENIANIVACSTILQKYYA